MKFVILYNPPGQEPQQWAFDQHGWTIGESKLIEAESGMLLQDFFNSVIKESATHQAIAWWVIRRRTEPDLRLGDLDDALMSYLHFLVELPAGGAEGKASAPEGPDEGDSSESPTSSSAT